jgi:hypothetical protein
MKTDLLIMRNDKPLSAANGRSGEAKGVRPKTRCKGDPELERIARERMAPLCAISKETGVPMGSLCHADQLLKTFESAELDRVAKQVLIGRAIFTAYRNGYEQGRAYQRAYQKRKAQRV